MKVSPQEICLKSAPFQINKQVFHTDLREVAMSAAVAQSPQII